MTKQAVTVYLKGEFMGNIQKIEGYLIDTGRMPYAQYRDAPFVDIKPRRKQKVRRYRQTFQPYMVIVEGWNAPDPDGIFGAPVTETAGLTVQKGRYAAFDEGWQKDFDAVLDKAIAGGLKVVADYRTKR